MKSKEYLQTPQDIMEECNGCSIPQYTAYPSMIRPYNGTTEGYTSVTEEIYTSLQ